MDALDVYQSNLGGFNFDNVNRNIMLEKTGQKLPGFQKTGTTICGVIFDGGVCLGADTRATNGPMVADKNCLKIHRIHDQIYCCGAGTSADCDNMTELIGSQLELHRLETDAMPRVVTCVTRLSQRLFRYHGHISAALIVGGVDSQGAHLYNVTPWGSVDRLPFVTMGSGSLAAMSVFESQYKENLDEKQAVQMVDNAIQAGIFNDLGSGSNVDICIIRNDGKVDMHRNYHKQQLNVRKYKRKKSTLFPKGTTEWLKETEIILKSKIEVSDMIDE